MERDLLENLHSYFMQKPNKNQTETLLLKRLTAELPYFETGALSREDLLSHGYDLSGVDDADMEAIAREMVDECCEKSFWESMDSAARKHSIPKHICPSCGAQAGSRDVEGVLYCPQCHNQWKIDKAI